MTAALTRQVVTPSTLDLRRNARQHLASYNDPQSKALAGRCGRLLIKIETGKYRTHCEISTELQSIIAEFEEMLKSDVCL